MKRLDSLLPIIGVAGLIFVWYLAVWARIVDPVLDEATPVHTYEPGTWGPAAAAAITPNGGWTDPMVREEVAH